MTPRNKHKAFDEAERILDLLASKKVTLFFTKDEIEAVMSFELQKGQTVQ